MKSNFAVFSTADVRAIDFCKQVATSQPPGLVETIHLPREKIIRLQKNSDVESVEVKSGMVWLTSTPANGDVLLSPGERFELRDNWPFVIQALEATELSLNRDFKLFTCRETK